MSKHTDPKWADSDRRQCPGTHEPPPQDPEKEMPGDVLLTPDAFFGFSAVDRSEHPGACIAVQLARNAVAIAKGTSADNVTPKYRSNYVFVEPREEFGLRNLTAFSTQPTPIRIHKAVLLYPERHIGRLTEDVLRELFWASASAADSDLE